MLKNWQTVAKNPCSLKAIFLPTSQLKQSSWNVIIGMKQRGVGLLYQSMRLPSDKTVGSLMSIRGEGSPLSVRSDSKRTTILSVLAVVDSTGGLGFAGTEGPHNSTNNFVESLKTFPRRPATSFCWTTWYFAIPVAFGLLPRLSEKRCFSFLRTLRGSTASKESFLSKKAMHAPLFESMMRSAYGDTPEPILFCLRKYCSFGEGPHLKT
jgi:hypothetical protein